jgi:poly-gamma-glutamate synthesis protein (capsule biosynthesis protein)
MYKGKLIAYSLGNFLAYERFNLEGASGRSFVLQARLDADTGDFVEGKAVSVRLVNEGIPELDPERQAVDLARRLTRQDIPNAGITIARDGTLARRQLPRTNKDQGMDRDAPMPRLKTRPR